MTIERFSLKFFARPGHTLDEAVLIEVFHEWIRGRKLEGILLDVVDYRHVPNGPGIMLITHDINFALDHNQGRLGLLAQRKSGAGRNHQERLLELAQATITFGSLLEADPRVTGRFQFEAGNFQYIANDRLLGPNRDETLVALQPDLKFVASLFYPDRAVSITKLINDPRHRLTVKVDSGVSIEMRTLQDTISVQNTIFVPA